MNPVKSNKKSSDIIPLVASDDIPNPPPTDTFRYQTPKREIDVGVEGEAQTGSTLFEGGGVMDSNLNSLYNVFGDQRLFEVKQGHNTMTLHCGGYYQKLPVAKYATGPIEIGSLHDIDTSSGSVTVTLPEKVDVGQVVGFIDSSGSWSVDNRLNVKCSQDDVIILNDTEIDLVPVVTRNTQATFICSNADYDALGNVTKSYWRFLKESMFGNYAVPVDIVGRVASEDGGHLIQLIGAGEVSGIAGLKLFIAATDETTGAPLGKSTSEMLVLIGDNDDVYSTEYAAMDTTKVKLFGISLSIDDGLIATVTSNAPIIQFLIKSIAIILK